MARLYRILAVLPSLIARFFINEGGPKTDQSIANFIIIDGFSLLVKIGHDCRVRLSLNHFGRGLWHGKDGVEGNFTDGVIAKIIVNPLLHPVELKGKFHRQPFGQSDR